MKTSIAVIAAALCLTTTLVWSHGKATGIVRERMDQMVVLKDAMKVLKAELTNGETYSAAAVSTAAKQIKDHSGEILTAKFPEGSLTKHSDALPSVWKEAARFSELADEMEQLAVALATAAEAEIPNIKSGVGVLGWLNDDADAYNTAKLRSPIDTFEAIAVTCKSCHDKFRKE